MRRGGGGRNAHAGQPLGRCQGAMCTRLAYMYWLSKEITAPVAADSPWDKNEAVALGTSFKVDGNASRIANSSWNVSSSRTPSTRRQRKWMICRTKSRTSLTTCLVNKVEMVGFMMHTQITTNIAYHTNRWVRQFQSLARALAGTASDATLFVRRAAGWICKGTQGSGSFCASSSRIAILALANFCKLGSVGYLLAALRNCSSVKDLKNEPASAPPTTVLSPCCSTRLCI